MHTLSHGKSNGNVDRRELAGYVTRKQLHGLGFVTRTKSRIRHDYKPLTPSTTAHRGRPATLLPAAMAAAGLAVAVAAFILLKPEQPSAEAPAAAQISAEPGELETVTTALPSPVTAGGLVVRA